MLQTLILSNSTTSSLQFNHHSSLPSSLSLSSPPSHHSFFYASFLNPLLLSFSPSTHPSYPSVSHSVLNPFPPFSYHSFKVTQHSLSSSFLPMTSFNCSFLPHLYFFLLLFHPCLPPFFFLFLFYVSSSLSLSWFFCFSVSLSLFISCAPPQQLTFFSLPSLPWLTLLHHMLFVEIAPSGAFFVIKCTSPSVCRL